MRKTVSDEIIKTVSDEIISSLKVFLF